MRFIVSALVLTLLVSCSSDNKTITYPNTTGLAYAESEEDFSSTYNNLRSELQNAELQIYKEIDFKEYAESNGKRSRETKLILYSNPSLEAPLISENPEIGMEFPTRLLTFEDRDKFVLVAYNNPEYLGRMYDINNMGAIQNLRSSLSNIASNTTGSMTMENETATAGRSALTISSSNTFNQTFNHLRNAITDSPEMNLVAEVNHQLNASTVGVEIRPNRILLLTMGKFEANLIDRHQLSAIDLPIRVLVWEDEDNITQVSYQFLETLMIRHQIDSKVDQLDEVKRTLAGMVIEAAN